MNATAAMKTGGRATMMETEQQRKERERQEDLAKLRGLRPMDDDFMRCIFKDNIPLAELVLRILLREPTLTVEKVETQRDNKRLVGGRSIFFDVYVGDQQRRKENVEIQRSDKGARKAQGEISFQRDGYREPRCRTGFR